MVLIKNVIRNNEKQKQPNPIKYENYCEHSIIHEVVIQFGHV